MSGPGIPEDATSDALVNTTDLFATVLDLAGAPRPANRKTDSVSLTPYFEDPSRASIRDHVYAGLFSTGQGPEAGGFAIRDARWKMVKTQTVEELYDLSSDPYETRNLLVNGRSEEEAHVVRELHDRVLRLRGPRAGASGSDG